MRVGTRLWVLLACVLGLAAVGGIAYATIPGGDGVIHGCYTNKGGILTVIDPSSGQKCSSLQTPISWNQQGPQGNPGPQGDPGSQGPEGPQGPAGPSDAFSVEQANEFAIPTGTPTKVLTLADVPAGRYAIFANIVVDNLNSPETIPVNCYLGSPQEFSPPYSARIDPFNSANAGAHTASGASVQTIALTLTTQLAAPGDITLLCQSNTGGNTADGSRRQITAIKVANLREDDLAP